MAFPDQTFTINGVIEPAPIPTQLQCAHIQLGGTCNNRGCYSECTVGRYQCSNGCCEGHEVKYEHPCVGVHPWKFNDESQPWENLRSCATEALPRAGTWALEIMADSTFTDERSFEMDIDWLVVAYEHGDAALVDTQVSDEWLNTVQAVNRYRLRTGLAAFDGSPR